MKLWGWSTAISYLTNSLDDSNEYKVWEWLFQVVFDTDP